MFSTKLYKNINVMPASFNHEWSAQLCEDDTLGVPKIEP